MTDGGSRAPRMPGGGRYAWWPFAVALGVAVALVATTLLLGAGSTGSRQNGTGIASDGSLQCPNFFEHADRVGPRTRPWVPADPDGVPAKKQLVPNLAPTHVTVCAYLGDGGSDRPASLKLSGEHELTGNLDHVTDTLITAKKRLANGSDACGPFTAGGEDDVYLIAMRYGEGAVWVSAPGDHCAGSSNGRFTTATNFGSDARAAYAARTWVAGTP